MDLPNYQFNAVPPNLIENVTKKSKSAKSFFRYLLMRTIKMFSYKNLPETIPADMLERYLQINGAVAITKVRDKYYAFNGSAGGEQDVYYRPTKFVISNPHISQLGSTQEKTFSKTATIFGDEEHDAVLIRNDTEWYGLTPLIARYAVLMSENTLTIRTADVLLRIVALLSAGTDKAKQSADMYLSKLESGELAVIMDPKFQESIKMQSPPSNNGSYLTQFIELQQYLKGSFFNELGLRANYNMKREAIGTGESTLDSDSLLPLCDNMLQCRQEDIAQLNELFGLDISVTYSSAWADAYITRVTSIVSQLGGADQDGFSSANKDQMNGVDPSSDMQGATRGNTGSDEDTEKSNEEGDNENVKRSNDDGSDAEDDGRAEEDDGKDDDENIGPGNEDGNDGDPDDESRREREKIKKELENGELTIAEAAVEVINDKISQLVEEVRENNDVTED